MGCVRETKRWETNDQAHSSAPEGESCEVDRGVKDGNGGCLGVDHEFECIERGVLMGRTHTRRTNTGQVNWGTQAVNWGAVRGQGMVWAAGTCRSWGGMEGEIRICGGTAVTTQPP